MTKPAGHLRISMPLTAAFIDDVRAAFPECAGQINASMQAGVRGETNRFHATEGEFAIGAPFKAKLSVCIKERQLAKRR